MAICIYTKRNVSPPFKLRACAEGWLSDGIAPTHVAECIERHLNENHRRYYAGSGDGGLPLVDHEIRESWRQLQRQAPKLLVTEDPCNRLAFETARGELLEAC